MSDKLTLKDLRLIEIGDDPNVGRPATLADWIEVGESLGGEVVGKRTIEWGDVWAGFPEVVLDYKVSKKAVGRYLVLRLDEEVRDLSDPLYDPAEDEGYDFDDTDEGEDK